MGTIAEKLAKVEETKVALKSAINGSGSVVGDNFSTYPVALTNAKLAIAQAITEKGVETSADVPLPEMATNIEKISSGFDGNLKQFLIDNGDVIDLYKDPTTIRVQQGPPFALYLCAKDNAPEVLKRDSTVLYFDGKNDLQLSLDGGPSGYIEINPNEIVCYMNASSYFDLYFWSNSEYEIH